MIGVPTLSGLIIPPPVEPEPLTDEAWYRVRPPVDKYSQLGLVVPGGTGPGVQAVPGGLVGQDQARQHQEGGQHQQTGGRSSSHHDTLSLSATETTGWLGTNNIRFLNQNNFTFNLNNSHTSWILNISVCISL